MLHWRKSAEPTMFLNKPNEIKVSSSVTSTVALYFPADLRCPNSSVERVDGFQQDNAGEPSDLHPARHLEPDPRPLGVHPVSEGCPEEGVPRSGKDPGLHHEHVPHDDHVSAEKADTRGVHASLREQVSNKALWTSVTVILPKRAEISATRKPSS